MLYFDDCELGSSVGHMFSSLVYIEGWSYMEKLARGSDTHTLCKKRHYRRAFRDITDAFPHVCHNVSVIRFYLEAPKARL